MFRSLVIKEMQKKMRFHFTHTSLAKIRKLDNAKHWWGLGEIKKPLAPPRNAGGGLSDTAILEGNQILLSKIKYDPAVLLPVYTYLREMLTHSQKTL